MSVAPWQQQIINPLEQMLQSDPLSGQSDINGSLRFVLDMLTRTRASGNVLLDRGEQAYGFCYDSFKIRPSAGGADGNVTLTEGFGLGENTDPSSAVNGVAGLADSYPVGPLYLSEDYSIPVPAADPTDPRIDLIEVKVTRQLIDSTSKLFINPTTGVWSPASAYKALSWDLLDTLGVVTSPTNSTTGIGYKKGVPTAGCLDSATDWLAARPAVTSGYIALGYINVPAAQTTFDTDLIVDERRIMQLYGFPRVYLNYTVPASSAAAVTVGVFSAPPGVTVLTEETSTNTGTFNSYILGALWANVMAIASNLSSGAGATRYVTNSAGRLDTADVSALATAGYDVALGQLMTKLSFVGAQTGTGTVNTWLDWGGGL